MYICTCVRIRNIHQEFYICIYKGKKQLKYTISESFLLFIIHVQFNLITINIRSIKNFKTNLFCNSVCSCVITFYITNDLHYIYIKNKLITISRIILK